MENTIYTIGHSTHPAPEFIALLKAHDIALLTDIRTIPRSRHNPQFNTENLKKSLKAEGISYLHLKELGGLRKTRKDSPNMGFRNSSFRGYADYMQTAEFEEALKNLIALSEKQPIAIMCAESVPWRCHRSLVSDALTVRHIPVMHIMPDGRLSEHHLTSFAKADDKTLTYPPPPDLLSSIAG